MPARDKYLVVKGSGGAGLGDRIRGLITAILYAKLSNRILHVDWKDTAYGDGTINLFNELFSLKSVPFVYVLPDVNSIYPPAWKNRLYLSFNDIRAADGAAIDGSDWNRQEAIERYSTDLGKLNYEEEVLVMWDFDQIEKLAPYFQNGHPNALSLDSFALQSRILKENICVGGDVQQQVNSFVNNYFAERYVIGIHVRHTKESQLARLTPSVEQYIDAIGLALKDACDAKIFLATDNRLILQIFENTFGQEKVVNINKWFPEIGDSIHKNLSCPDPVRAAKDALIDLVLLSRCNKLIVLHNSSFSILARMWSDLREEDITVLFPKSPLTTKIRSKLFFWGQRISR